ncbi:hypothetical protein ONZ51_g1561 [Trametes cubensis]|uniref:Uncharacterized protein n=1 Tax=Trametes cubensis TaxID=1111947 RepID=A0AAD7U3Z9_9APHY|nr:hypothetical protein ONZ51_g1561 [Trametes cubensis]
MKDIDLIDASLLGLWIHLLATGAYLAYLPECVLRIIRKRRQHGISLLIPIACTLIFILTMINLFASLARAYMAFSVPSNGQLPDPVAVYADSAALTSLLRNIMIIAVSTLSDMVFVYRTYIVWNMNIYIVVLPITLLLGVIALGIWVAWSLALTKTGDEPILATVSLVTQNFFIVSFCLNVVCAGLICWKIWRVRSQTSRVYGNLRPNGTNIVEIIVQTAALYCSYLLILIIADGLGSNVFFLFLDSAIVFTMLIVRPRVGDDERDTMAGQFQSRSGTRFGSTTGMLAEQTAGARSAVIDVHSSTSHEAPATVGIDLGMAIRTEESRGVKD